MRRNRVIQLLAVGFVGAAGVVAAGSARDDRDMQELMNRVAALVGAPRAAGAQETFGEVRVANAAGQTVALLASDSVGDGIAGVLNARGGARVAVAVTAQDAGRVEVANNVGRATFAIDGLSGLIAASGDLAETFPMAEAAQPGAVVVIDAEHRGAMRLANSPYDRRVAGVIAGANNYKSAITLRAMESTEGRQPVTLTGTAYCLASNANGVIKAGDLLTTSAVPGHAMKVTDHEAARGAILGKALEDLKGDKGHILILASLQ